MTCSQGREESQRRQRGEDQGQSKELIVGIQTLYRADQSAQERTSLNRLKVCSFIEISSSSSPIRFEIAQYSIDFAYKSQA